MQTYITFGTIRYAHGGLDTACRLITARSERGAIRIAERLGNLPKTTIAYTDEALVELASERPDYIDGRVAS